MSKERPLVLGTLPSEFGKIGRLRRLVYNKDPGESVNTLKKPLEVNGR
jgi:hypothetical protein